MLDLVEHGQRPRIKDAALGLLSNALDHFPTAGHNRVGTPYGANVPLCCAIARHIRGRRSALLTHGVHGKQLMAKAELHWRLTIEEAELQDDSSLIAIAVLEGAPFQTPVEAELRTPPLEPAQNVRINALTTDTSRRACIELGQAPSEPVPGSALYPSECGRREH
ncbi:hypothetical protein [Streptomyces sp. Ru72]|uniref:hypothetical protein n=1 Tax=Streptomyces sp. Ru72 TaxID=2080747 RepID=UPI0011B0B78E|nr:hypothetical protein [Streptomyces sp. Ru72]